MIALPVKTMKEDTTITTVFGKAKYIAFIDEAGVAETVIKENPVNGGRALAGWLIQEGVKKVVFKDMGANPYLTLHQHGIEVYFCTEKRPSLGEIKEAVMGGKAIRVTPENMGEYLDSHSHHGHHHKEGNGHHHGEGCCGHHHGEGHGHHHH